MVGEGSSEETSDEVHGLPSAGSNEHLTAAPGSSENLTEEKVTYVSCGSHDIAPNFETIYASIFVLTIYLLPLLVICLNYVNIVRFLWRVAKQTEASGSAGAVSKGKVKVVKMLAIVTGVFAALWAPYFVLFAMEVCLKVHIF